MLFRLLLRFVIVFCLFFFAIPSFAEESSPSPSPTAIPFFSDIPAPTPTPSDTPTTPSPSPTPTPTPTPSSTAVPTLSATPAVLAPTQPPIQSISSVVPVNKITPRPSFTPTPSPTFAPISVTSAVPHSSPAVSGYSVSTRSVTGPGFLFTALVSCISLCLFVCGIFLIRRDTMKS